MQSAGKEVYFPTLYFPGSLAPEVVGQKDASAEDGKAYGLISKLPLCDGFVSGQHLLEERVVSENSLQAMAAHRNNQLRRSNIKRLPKRWSSGNK